jgi:uncharacterized protein YjbI with pentapeptide repeats
MTVKESILAGLRVYFDPSFPDTEREVKSEWICEALRNNRPVVISNGCITGELYFQNDAIPKQLSLEQCHIIEKITVYSSVFADEILLKKSTLAAGIELVHAQIGGYFNVKNCTIGGKGFAATTCIFYKGILGEEMVLSSFNAADITAEGPLLMSGLKVEGKFKFLSNRCKKNVFMRGSEFGGEVIFMSSIFEEGLQMNQASVKKKLRIRDSRFLTQLNLNDSHFEEVQFSGNTNEQGVSIQASVFNAKAEFNSSVALAQWTFTDSTINGDFSMNGCRVGHGFFFQNCIVNKAAGFFHNDFCHQANFSGSRFTDKEQEISFYGSRFFIDCNFIETQFSGRIRFESVRVDRNCNFKKAQFHGAANFQSSIISRAAVSECVFWSQACFVGTFFEMVSFSESRFADVALFSLCKFDHSVTFEYVKFEQRTAFTYAQFGVRAEFESAIFSGDADFSFCKINVLTFSEDGLVDGTPQFGKKVELLGCTYEHLFIDWKVLISKFNTAEYKREPYSHLEHVLKANGHTKAADDLYYLRKRIESSKLSFRRRPFPWLGDRILWLLTGYGVRLQRLIYITAVLLLFGTIIFNQPNSVELNSTKVIDSLNVIEAFWFTVDLIFPVDLSAGKPWSATSMTAFGGLVVFRVVATLLELAGWVLIPVGVAGLTGLLKR